MGYITDTCAADNVTTRIKKLRTYQRGGDEVEGFAWKEEGGEWNSYNIPTSSLPRYRNNIITWQFDNEEEPVVGMYGMMNDEQQIVQLGWLQYDVQCQRDFENGIPGAGGNTPADTSSVGDDVAVEVFEDRVHDLGGGVSGTGAGTGSRTGPGTPSSAGSGTVSATDAEQVNEVINAYIPGTLDWDLSARVRVTPGEAYVGYPNTEGDDIAVAVFEGNVHDGGIALKGKNVQGKSNYDGFYLGAGAGLMALLAYGAYATYQEKKEKTVGDSQPFMGSDSGFSLV